MVTEQEHVELNESKWDLRAETFDDKRYDYFRDMQKRVISLIPLKKGQRFLDIGCGTGWAVMYSASIVEYDGEFYGVDISSKMVERATKSAIGRKNIFFYKASAENLPFNDKFFDFIICTNSFHHYLHPSKVLDEVYRVLKPGGRVYIMDPTSDGLIVKLWDWFAKNREMEHVKFYSSNDYRQLFVKSGLKYTMTKTIWTFEKAHIGEK